MKYGRRGLRGKGGRMRGGERSEDEVRVKERGMGGRGRKGKNDRNVGDGGGRMERDRRWSKAMEEEGGVGSK